MAAQLLAQPYVLRGVLPLCMARSEVEDLFFYTRYDAGEVRLQRRHQGHASMYDLYSVSKSEGQLPTQGFKREEIATNMVELQKALDRLSQTSMPCIRVIKTQPNKYEVLVSHDYSL